MDHAVRVGDRLREAGGEGGLAVGRDGDEARGLQHDFGDCIRHYKLCVLDFARMVIARFLAGASPRTFRQKANMPNVGLCYRSEPCCALFVARVDDLLSELDRDTDLTPRLSRRAWVD